MTYVLLTRPEEDCQEIKSKIIIPAVSSPLLKVSQSVNTVKIPKGTTDLIVTSARVFDMVKNIKDMVKTPVWCVGEATATAAKEAGFETIFQVNRSAQEILERIVNECQKDTSHFVHICGSVVHVDLADALTKLGYNADRIVIYTTEAADRLTPEAEAVMSAGLVQQMPFFSLRTAEVFIEIAQKSDWAENLSKVTALAHSEAIARVLNQLSWKRVIVVPDLSAERIQEYYIRSGDSPMKTSNTLSTLVLVIGIAGVVAVATKLLWPDQSVKIEATDLTPVYAKIDKLQAAIQALPNPNEKLNILQERIEKLEEKPAPEPTPEKPVEEAPKVEIPVDTHQALTALKNQILDGVVTKDSIEKANMALPASQQIPSTILSIRDLMDKLALLPDLTDEVTVETTPTIGEKASEILGLNVRKSKTSPLKQQAHLDLSKKDFTFIKNLEKKTLSPDWVRWISACKDTENTIHTLNSLATEKGE